MEFKKGFLLYFDELWQTINLRNPTHQFTDGLLRMDIRGINETVAREAILNAIAHRDYRLPGSIFIRQFPKRLEIVSPGGLPPGVTVDNLLWRQMPRNRRLAEAFAKCGLVEWAGQGANRMFERCIAEGKARSEAMDDALSARKPLKRGEMRLRSCMTGVTENLHPHGARSDCGLGAQWVGAPSRATKREQALWR